jgi:hypothetical protein
MMHFAAVSLPENLPPYTVHQYLYSFFPQHQTGAPRPFLFRQSGDRCLLLSRIPPACRHAEALIEAGRSYGIDGVVALEISKSQGFRRGGAGPKSEVTPLLDNAKRRAYFVDVVGRKGGTVGFCQFFDLPPRRFKHADGNVIHFFPARVKAVALVRDADLFSEMLLKGIGSKKAFGNGMLYLPDAMRLPEVADATA